MITQSKLHLLPTLAQREYRYIARVLRIVEGDITLAARVLGIGRATLYRRIRGFDIETRGQRKHREACERLRRLKEIGR